MKPNSSNIRRLLPLLVIALAAAGGFFLLRDLLSFDALRDHRETLIAFRDSNYAVASIIFIGIYIIVVAFSLPGATVMTLTGGFLFAIFPGALYCVIGATVGAIGIFMATKTGLGDMLHKKLASQPGLLQKMEAGLRENEISFLFLLRLVPAVPFFLANLAPAFLGVGLRNFAFTTFFGIMPGTIIYAAVGSGLGEVFDKGQVPNLGVIFEWHILGPILGLCASATLPIAIKAYRKRKNKKEAI